MANEQNLIPLNKRTQRERKEIATKGAAAANAKIKQRKALKDSMNVLLGLIPSDTRDYNKLANAGIPLEDIDNSQLIVLALFNRAKKGDVAAIKELRAMIDEVPESTDALKEARDLLRGVPNAID